MVMTVVHGRCFLLSRTSTWPFLAVEEFFQSPLVRYGWKAVDRSRCGCRWRSELEQAPE